MAKKIVFNEDWEPVGLENLRDAIFDYMESRFVGWIDLGMEDERELEAYDCGDDPKEYARCRMREVAEDIDEFVNNELEYNPALLTDLHCSKDEFKTGLIAFLKDRGYLEESLKEDYEARVADVEYNDDDGYDQHALVFAGDLDEEGLTDLLYDQGMLYVCVNKIFEKDLADKYEVGDVIEDLSESLKEIKPEALGEGYDEIAASKAFWAAAKNKEINAEAFHKAFDKDIQEADLSYLFNKFGVLGSRDSYAVIKNSIDQDTWLARALKKLWALQFVDGVKTEAEIKAEEERKKEIQAAHEKYKADIEAKKAEAERLSKEKTEEIRNLLDQLYPGLMQRAKAEAKRPDKFELPDYELSFDTYKNALSKPFYVYGRGMDEDGYGRVLASQKIVEDPKAAAKYIADRYEEMLKELEKDKPLRAYPWYNALKAGHHLGGDDDLYLQGEDGTVAKLTFNHEVLEEGDIGALPSGAELVIYVKHSYNTSSYTYKDSYSWTYYAVSDKANSEAIKESGVLLDPSEHESDIAWGHSTYKELDKAEAEHIGLPTEGMDRWFKLSCTFYATD